MDTFNDDEKVPPTWFDKDFFEMVLRKYEKDDTIVISKLSISPGSEKGDHLASILFRVVAEYSSRSADNNKRSMIAKTLPDEDGFKKELLEDLPVFTTEINMYTDEVPKFEDVLRKYGDPTRMGSKILYHSLKPRKVIVMEDLVALGYDCIRDRLVKFDEVKICLSKLAKWHAVSYKLASEGDESVKRYNDGMLAKPKEELPKFIGCGLQFLIEAVSKIEDLKVFAEKLKTLDATLMPKCNDIFRAHSKGLKGIMVLNHGDFHARNLMFKFDKDNKVEDVVFVDFQIACYAPAVVDISYIIFMLLTEEMRKHHREELIHYYFSIFLETLGKIEFAGELPTLTDFYIDMYRYKEYELWVMATFLPLVYELLDSAGQVGTEDIISTDDSLRKTYSNPKFLAELRCLLPKYLYNGYLA